MLKSLINHIYGLATEDCHNDNAYIVLSRLMGIIYLVALAPLFFQIKALVGVNGLQPANELLQKAYSAEGIDALFHFPSLYWLFPNDNMLLLLVVVGCIAAIGLLLNFKPFISSLAAWLCFTSLCVVGGDFLIIIIDLFLSEVGFLLILLHASRNLYGYVPRIIDISFKVLNFRLWFSMGMIKFYFPGNTWTDWSFFHNFFQFQPMPAPLAFYFHNLPLWMHTAAELWLFVSQLLIPFFVFGSRPFRLLAFAAFAGTSVLIMLTGNYGYFNILSIVVAVILLKIPGKITLDIQQQPLTKSAALRNTFLAVCAVPLLMQFIYTIALFDPKPPGYQNHFNVVFLYPKAQTGVTRYLAAPFKPLVFARVCNPYGVFKSIPRFRIELRFSGSHDSVSWQPYEFNFVPSGNTQVLKYFAPYYPRIDHLLFYETLDAGGYNFNLLNNYNTRGNVWTGRFIKLLFENDPGITSLLGKNPFSKAPPSFIRCDAYSLKFNTKNNIGHPWEEELLKTVYVGTNQNIPDTPLLNSKYIYSIMPL